MSNPSYLSLLKRSEKFNPEEVQSLGPAFIAFLHIEMDADNRRREASTVRPSTSRQSALWVADTHRASFQDRTALLCLTLIELPTSIGFPINWSKSVFLKIVSGYGNRHRQVHFSTSRGQSRKNERVDLSKRQTSNSPFSRMPRSKAEVHTARASMRMGRGRASFLARI